MALVEAVRLSKSFRTFKKEPGFRGSLSGLWRRRYETTLAVDSVSFRIEPGERVGFLGPNGAGKTTTLKMLSGLIHPTSGSARVMGYVPWERKDGYRRRFALLLGQKNQLWWDLPAIESLNLNARIYSLDPGECRTDIERLTHLLEVHDKLQVMVRELSLGERMKFELIAALLHRPSLLLLDEPTIGLDVISQKTIRLFLDEYSRLNGTTMMLTSHYMADVKALCERVIIVNHGRITFDGELSAVVDRFSRHKHVTIHWDGPGGHGRDWFLRHGDVVGLEPGCVRLKIPRDRVIPACKALLGALPVTDLDISETPIEDILEEAFLQGRAGAIED